MRLSFDNIRIVDALNKSSKGEPSRRGKRHGMNSTIPGGGDSGTLMATECASKQHRGTVHTSRPRPGSPGLDAHARDDAFPLAGRIVEVTAHRSRAARAAGSIRIILSAEPIPAPRGNSRPMCGRTNRPAASRTAAARNSPFANFRKRDVRDGSCANFGRAAGPVVDAILDITAKAGN